MLLNEPLLEDWIAVRLWLPWVVYVVLIGGVLLAGVLRNRTRAERGARSDNTSGI